ncbi:MAG: hypothetical protein ACRYGL_16250, partial [Janthinobacterium lividum]
SSAAPAKAPVPALADTGAADAASSSDRATGAGRQGVRAVERPAAGPAARTARSRSKAGSPVAD